MGYLDTIVSKHVPISNAIQFIKHFPIFHNVTDIYKRLSKNQLIFGGMITLYTFNNLLSYIKKKHQGLNLPPTAPFALPFIGHSLYVYYMPFKFIDWCEKRYGEVYSLKMFGKTVTIAGGKSAEEALKSELSELSLDHGFLRDIVHLDYAIDEYVMDSNLVINPVVVKASLSSTKIPLFHSIIQNGLSNACKKLLKEPSTVVKHPSEFFQTVVAHMTVPTLLGAEFGSNADLLETFTDFTGNAVSNIGLYMITPKFLHKYLMPYTRSPKKHIDCVLKYIAPVVHKRRKIMQLAGEEHGFLKNYFQCLIEYVNSDGSVFTAEEISQTVLLISFASVHTTSRNLSFGVYWLLARPDLKEKFMAEIESFIPGDTPITSEALTKMKFLNNFIREVLRQGGEKFANGKKAMRDFTFSNGYQVPKGRLVESTIRQLNFGDNYTRNQIDEMDPEMSMNKVSTSPARDFAAFGLGKHVCPGRFFAVEEIQRSIVYLFKNYDIKVISGKRPTPVESLDGNIVANCEEPLLFTRKN